MPAARARGSLPAERQRRSRGFASSPASPSRAFVRPEAAGTAMAANMYRVGGEYRARGGGGGRGAREKPGARRTGVDRNRNREPRERRVRRGAGAGVSGAAAGGRDGGPRGGEWAGSRAPEELTAAGPRLCRQRPAGRTGGFLLPPRRHCAPRWAEAGAAGRLAVPGRTIVQLGRRVSWTRTLCFWNSVRGAGGGELPRFPFGLSTPTWEGPLLVPSPSAWRGPLT